MRDVKLDDIKSYDEEDLAFLFDVPEIGYVDDLYQYAAARLIVNKHGMLQFRINKLVTYLYVENKIDLNLLWNHYRYGMFSKEDFKQFYRDIGYTIEGFFEIWMHGMGSE